MAKVWESVEQPEIVLPGSLVTSKDAKESSLTPARLVTGTSLATEEGGRTPIWHSGIEWEPEIFITENLFSTGPNIVLIPAFSKHMVRMG